MQVIANVTKPPVCDGPIRSVQHQEARVISRFQRRLGDELGRQIVVEVGSSQWVTL